MRKIVYYIPTIIFSFFYSLVVIGGGISIISPVAAVWLVLFLTSGILLSKNIFWGSLLGALPAIHMIYMGTQETGQIINEIPIGIIVLVFYIICGSFVFFKNKKKV
ncbi:hypothetical protein [Anaerocolumna sp. MB42-C2]|uniref:hypothetical protein n=1 Tax=Anaerocolumna sp. MB42-C2 TaxID=3070997 RepID=UPI0027E1F4AC|nr:hypothetical protein [Anaerocolumna sp. MB42-C2]WMJ90136.1 hypothetical protein RBU59_11610 [Anaerocolumna sp. MB42-C2]